MFYLLGILFFVFQWINNHPTCIIRLKSVQIVSSELTNFCIDRYNRLIGQEWSEGIEGQDGYGIVHVWEGRHICISDRIARCKEGQW